MPLICDPQRNNGTKLFGSGWLIWKTGGMLQALLDLPTTSNYSITNCRKFPVFHSFWKCGHRGLKMVNIDS